MSSTEEPKSQPPAPSLEAPKSVPESSTTEVPTPASTTASIAADPLEEEDKEDTFYAGALKRTGTLYKEAKDGVLKSGGTVSEAFSGGLKRTGTLLGDAREGIAIRSASIGTAASQGLQRTGTLFEGARQNIFKGTGNLSENTKIGLQRTGTLLVSARDGAIQRAGTFSEWAVEYAKGIYDPDRPMKATFQEVYGVALPRTLHSISIINGRAYIWGGEDETGALADNDMHVVILPSSSVLEADYKSIAPRSATKGGPVPAARKGHTAVVVGDQIFIFGGQLAEKAKEEACRVWVYDTFTAKWSFHEPKADAPYPPPRWLHAAVSSELPGPKERPEESDETEAQAQYLTPEIKLPASDTEASNQWGTFFIYGGISPTEPEQLLNDVWAFDIATRSWLPMPPPPSPARLGASLVLSGSKLYRAGGKTDPEHVLETDYLDVEDLFKVRGLRGSSNKQLTLPRLLSEWTSVTLTAPLLGPHVSLADPGDGRKFLFSIQPGAKSITAVDISPEAGMLILAGTAEIGEGDEIKAPQQVVAVQVQYADLYGEVVRGQLARTFGAVSGFAVEKGTEVEEASLVIWGGKDPSGKPVGNGWMIRFEQ